MPMNQPTTYIQRGPRNYVNVSGAILAPLAQSLGEVASSGVKDLLGIHTPAEEYQQSLIAANNRALDDKIGSAWDESMADPNFAAQVESDPDFKRRWAEAKFGDSDKAAAFVDTHLSDPFLSQEIRKAATATQRASNADPVPNLAGGGPVGINPNGGGYTPYPSAPAPSMENPQVAISKQVQQEAPPAPPPVATGAQQGEQLSQAIQQGAGQVQSSTSSRAIPETPGVAPVAPPNPQSVPGTKPDAGADAPQPLDVNKFQSQVQQYMLRQQGRLGLYRQVVNAAQTGKMDAGQAALAASLSGVHQSELTSLMETVAPSMGLPLKDNDGNAIQGGALMDGFAYTFMISNPEGFKQLPPGMQQLMRDGANRYQTLLGKMDASKALTLNNMVDQFSKSKLADPNATLNYLNAEKNRQVAMVQHKDSVRIQERQLSFEEAKLVPYLQSQKIANDYQRQQLAILTKYGDQEAGLKLQAAQNEINMNKQKMGILLAKADQDTIAAGIAAYTSLYDTEEKRGLLWFQANQKQQAAYANQVASANQRIGDLLTKNQPIQQAHAAKMEKLRGSMNDKKVDAWLSTQGKAIQEQYQGASPQDKFMAYYCSLPENSEYAQYRNQLVELQGQRDNAQKLMEGAISAEMPQQGNADVRSAVEEYTKSTLAPLMRTAEKGRFKNSDPTTWDDTLAANPTALNIILGKTTSKNPTDAGWSMGQSQGLLHLVRDSMAAGTRLDPKKLGAAVVGKDAAGRPVTLSAHLGARFGNYYNDYVQLLEELK